MSLATERALIDVVNDNDMLIARIAQLEAALAAAAVKVPAEVVDMAGRVLCATDHYLGFTQDSLQMANFILQLAGRKDVKNGN